MSVLTQTDKNLPSNSFYPYQLIEKIQISFTDTTCRHRRFARPVWNVIESGFSQRRIAGFMNVDNIRSSSHRCVEILHNPDARLYGLLGVVR
jgi:hypothetical protein